MSTEAETSTTPASPETLTNAPPTTVEPTPPVPTNEPAPTALTSAPEFTPITAEALTIPEGFTIDEAQRDGFLALANELKLPAETANKLVAFQANLSKAASEGTSKAWEEHNKTWQNEVRADPEIGGQKLDGVLSGISKVIDQYGSPELRQALASTGAGNNIHVVRFIHKIAGVLTEAGPISGSPGKVAQSLENLLYDHPTSRKA